MRMGADWLDVIDDNAGTSGRTRTAAQTPAAMPGEGGIAEALPFGRFVERADFGLGQAALKKPRERQEQQIEEFREHGSEERELGGRERRFLPGRVRHL